MENSGNNFSYIEGVIRNISSVRKPNCGRHNYKGGFDRYQIILVTAMVMGAVVLPVSLVYGMTFLMLDP